MEFWGVEVKQGQSLKVTPEQDKIIHLSQASLGEVKDEKSSNRVPLRLKVGDKKFVVGTLSAGDRPQIMFDLVIEKEFELSHDWKNGSVYFIGYKSLDPCLENEVDGAEFSESDEDLSLDGNGKFEISVGAKPPVALPLPSKKSALKQAEPKKVEPESDEDDDSDGDDEDSDASMEDGGSSDEDDSEEDESDEETPVKAKQPQQQMKKRPAESVPQTNAQKKAKQATPDKSGGKKGTPAKQPAKSPQQFNNSNKKSPKKFNQKKR